MNLNLILIYCVYDTLMSILIFVVDNENIGLIDNKVFTYFTLDYVIIYSCNRIKYVLIIAIKYAKKQNYYCYCVPMFKDNKKETNKFV